MSVISENNMSRTCVPTLVKSPLSMNEKVAVAKTLRNAKSSLDFTHVDKIQSILLAFKNQQAKIEYENLNVMIRESQLNDENLASILTQTINCISILDEDLHSFVISLLKVKWKNRHKSIVKKYQTFLLDLISCHCYYEKAVFSHLVDNFFSEQTETEWENGKPSKQEIKQFNHIHNTINFILKVIPMSEDIFLETIEMKYPYFKRKTHDHETYLYNLLWIIEYRPKFRVDVLTIIFKNLIILDVNSPSNELEDYECNVDEYDTQMNDSTIFEMDQDNMHQQTLHPIGHTLDICMLLMFNYIKEHCFKQSNENNSDDNLNTEKTKKLFKDFIQVFDDVILQAHSYHVQFLLYYLCSLKKELAEDFLKILWSKLTNPNFAQIFRQAAISYIASCLARASFLNLSILKEYIQKMADWIHNYISNYDGANSMQIADLRVHVVFYSTCQSLFYLIAFRHTDLVKKQKGLVFLQNLNLGKIVASRLNPLKVCSEAVLNNFAAVTRTYQLCYCYSIIEQNSRHNIPIMYKNGNQITSFDANLDALFPFDPYLLKKSFPIIQSIYLEYQRSEEKHNHQVSNDMEDDFLGENDTHNDSYKHVNQELFSYSTSPGFKT